MKHYCLTGRRNHGRHFEEASGHVRPGRVNRWPNCMTDDDDDDYDDEV
jgi:hypothetical protein